MSSDHSAVELQQAPTPTAASSPQQQLHHRHQADRTVTSTPVDDDTVSKSTATAYQPNTDLKSSAESAGTSEDLYAQDRQRHPYLAFWYRWINPWVRWLLIIVILYLYCISSGVLTYRGNTFQDEMQLLVNTQSSADSEYTLPGDPSSTRPEREYGVTDYYGLDGREYVPFVLRDLFFDFIPALQGNTRTPWKTFADFTAIFWNIVLLLMLIIRMDVVRWSEYLSIQMILFSVNALVHVSTTYPDAGGYQTECRDPKYHVYGSWMFTFVSTQYCNDMMWSGHTQETLLPIIMIRRLMWDFLGWNLTWTDLLSSARKQMLEKHRYLFSGMYNEYERNQLWQHHNATVLHRDAKQLPLVATNLSSQKLQDQAPQYADLQQKTDDHQSQPASSSSLAASQTESTPYSDVQQIDYPSKPASSSPATSESMPPSKVADEVILHPHENHDVHINVHAATTLHAHQQPNFDHDIFFKIYKSPYQTPDIVERYRKSFYALSVAVRVVFVIWFPFLIISLILIRYHYSADIIVATFVTLLCSTNTHLLQWFVRMIYRPYYHNYLHGNSFWQPVYLKWPLNEEQVNYEERIRRVGIGGIL